MNTVLGIVKQLCASKNITATELERVLDFGVGTIHRWGTSSPSADKLQKVADYFGVSVDYLLGRDSNATVTDDDIKFALFGGDGEITDEQYDEVKRFAQFVKERNGNH